MAQKQNNLHLRLLILIVCALTFFNSSHATSIDVETGKNSDLHTGNKLDRIIDAIESLNERVNQLGASLQRNYGCQKPSKQISDKAQPQALLSGDEDTKREERASTPKPKIIQEADQMRDLFHFNKLAPNINMIPDDTQPPAQSKLNQQSTENAELSLENWLASGKPNKHFLLAMGQQYESMFGVALDNLSNIMKEQLVGFRLTLNKLMNRILDQSYQYNLINNQLTLVKDECSLAANLHSTLVNLANSSLSLVAMKQSGKPTCDEATSTGSGAVGASMPSGGLKSSDITMIVRLLSLEMDQLVRSTFTSATAAAVASFSNQQQASQKSSIEQDLDKLESGLNKETKSLQVRLDEIGSVVKQSALLLNKLLSNGNGDLLWANKNSTVVMLFNNTSDQDEDNLSRPASGPKSTTRWFPGSKIPGTSRSTAQISERRGDSSGIQKGTAGPTLTCQSRTNLTTPSSCRQLRLAGANCTGQYYVFVRNSIRHVYCHMSMDSEDDGGGWTVILRRIDKSLSAQGSQTNPNQTQATPPLSTGVNRLLESFKASQVNFNLDWYNYKLGFGQLNEWSEFFIGLDLLHQLTQDSSPGTNQTELQIDVLTDQTGEELHLRFEDFQVKGEDSQFELRVDAASCNATQEQLCQPISSLDGLKFYTFDRAVNQSSLCDDGTKSGWWRAEPTESSACPPKSLTLTAPMGRQPSAPDKGEPQHLYWPRFSANPIRQLEMKIRRKRLPAQSWLSV